MFISVVIVFISKCVWLFIAVVESSSISTSKSIDLDNFNEINSNLNKNNVDKQQFDETDPIYWYVQAYRNLQRRQYLLPSSSSITNRPAKNVILFLGDGMGISTITASRILKGQQQQQHGQYHHSNNGEEAMLEMDLFPFTALIKVSQFKVQCLKRIQVQILLINRLIMLINKYRIRLQRQQHFYPVLKIISIH